MESPKDDGLRKMMPSRDRAGWSVTYRSPEYKWRTGLFLVLAVLNLLAFLEEPPDVVDLLILAVFAMLAWRSSTVRTIVDHEGVTDRRTFTRKFTPWAHVAGVEVGRSDGLRGGHCVKLIDHDGKRHGLSSTQAYTFVPSASHHQQVLRLGQLLHKDLLAHRVDG